MRNKKANIKLDGESKPIIIAEKPMIFKNPKCMEKIPQLWCTALAVLATLTAFLFLTYIPNNNFYRNKTDISKIAEYKVSNQVGNTEDL